MKLYKYRSLEDEISKDKTIESLLNNYFWAPSKETLNDPCEGYYSIEAYNKFMDFAALISPKVDKNDLNNQFYSVQNMIKSSGIFSLSKSSTIAAMWASYTKDHAGICIEYDLEDLISKNKGLYQYFDVVYSDTPPDIGLEDIDGDTAIQKIIGTKSLHWKYEQEFRIICDNKGENYHRSDAVRAIIFGLKTSDEVKNEVMKLLSGRNIQFKQLVNDGKSYGFHTQNIVNPFDEDIETNGDEKIDFENLVPDEVHVQDDHKVFMPYFYKILAFMQSYPDCIKVADINFSQTSTTEDPIIYVNFTERGSTFPYSKKFFRIKDMD